jgi:hypothetical protein
MMITDSGVHNVRTRMPCITEQNLGLSGESEQYRQWQST